MNTEDRESRVESREPTACRGKTPDSLPSPQPSALNSQPSSHGFTLIELLTVIVIIAILAALLLAGSKYALSKGARSRAQSEIAAMETALETFKNDHGVYPLTDPALNRTWAKTNSPLVYTALVDDPKIRFPFKPDQIRVTGIAPNTITNIVDPFGQPYNYYCKPGAVDQTNSVTFDLWSTGPDGQNDTADDIVNWRR